MSRWYQHRKNCQCPECRWHRQNQKTHHHSSSNHPVNKKQWEQIKKSLNDEPPEKYERLPPPPAGKIFTTCFWLVVLAIVIAVIYYASNGINYVSSHKDDIVSSVSSAANNALDTANQYKDDAVNKFSSITSSTPTPKPSITPVPTLTTTALPVVVPKSTFVPVPTTIAPPVAIPIPTPAKPNIDVNDYAARFNAYRQSKGFTPLIFTNDLNKNAALRLSELQTNYSHNSAGQYNLHLAENIVMGTYNNQDSLVCWKNSPGHNANMLNSTYKYTGYAAGNGYAVQLFTDYPTVNGVPQLPPGWRW